MRSRCCAVMAAASMALGVGAPAAKADVALDYFWSNIQCGFANPGGAVTTGACASPSFSAVVEGGGYAFVTATFNYSYRDDGLTLPSPVSFQANARGTQLVTVSNEAAAIYFFSSTCTTFETCLDITSRERTSTNPIFLVLGNNATPDALSGSFVYTATVRAIPPFGGEVNPFLSVGVTQIAGVAAPIPEPSAWALMLAGLCGATWVARRRRARQPTTI